MARIFLVRKERMGREPPVESSRIYWMPGNQFLLHCSPLFRKVCRMTVHSPWSMIAVLFPKMCGDVNHQLGSLIIRDLRLWHAGMPNATDEIRIMLAMIHFAPWYRQRMIMKLPRSLRPILEGADRLGVAADWQDAEVDHLDAPYGNAFDFSQDQ